MTPTAIDFSRSLIRFRVDLTAQPAITLSHKPPTTVNNVRIGIECRCEIRHRSSGLLRVYALGASCKTERVGADRDLRVRIGLQRPRLGRVYRNGPDAANP